MKKTHIKYVVQTLTFPTSYNWHETSLTRIRISNGPIKCYHSLEEPGSLKFMMDNKTLSPTYELHKRMVLVIVSFLSLLYMLNSFLGSSNKLLYLNNKPSMGFPTNPCTNYTVYGVYQFLAKEKLSWKGLCARANLTIQ